MNFDVMNALYGRHHVRPKILDELPAECRNVLTRSTHRIIGRFPSFKCRRNQPWDSEIERDQVTLLEFDPTVVAYSMQPAWLPLLIDGQECRHCPDILVIRKSGRREYLEVKSDTQAKHPEVEATMEAAKLHCREIGYGYVLATASDIRVKPRLTNAQLMVRYRGHHVPKDRRFQIMTRFGDGSLTVEQYMRETGLEFSDAKVELLHLAAWEHLTFDWDQAVGLQSVFKLPE